MKVVSGVLIGILGMLAIYIGLEEAGIVARNLLSQDGAPKPPLGYVLMGAGVVAIVLGAIRAGSSSNKKGEEGE